MNRKKDVILRATVALTENYKKEELQRTSKQGGSDRCCQGTSFCYFSGLFLE